MEVRVAESDPRRLVVCLESPLVEHDPGIAPVRDVVLAGLRWGSGRWPALAVAWIEQGALVDDEIAGALGGIAANRVFSQRLRHRAFAFARRFYRSSEVPAAACDRAPTARARYVRRMDQQAVHAYLVSTFVGVETLTASGYVFYFQGADRMMPFVTVATEDNEHDRASQLDRPSVFRLNVGVGKDTYRALFGAQPKPPEAGGVVATGHDFAALDVLMPHPIYAYTSWVAVNAPSEATFERVKPLVAEAWAIAVRREQRQ